MFVRPYSDPVNRVHWIRARAQKHRWKEELTLTGYEMQWTVRYYLHQAEIWTDREIRTEHSGDSGAMAYARRQSVRWTEAARAANIRFKSINSTYQSLAGAW